MPTNVPPASAAVAAKAVIAAVPTAIKGEKLFSSLPTEPPIFEKPPLPPCIFFVKALKREPMASNPLSLYSNVTGTELDMRKEW
ncbi:MAG: hypothetical protein IAE97_05505 [Chthoniobacterales bacterium]|nr:hypothetical protein [Chthoniobacterales bacterium]